MRTRFMAAVAPWPALAVAQTAHVVEYYHTDALRSVRTVTKIANGQVQVGSRHDYMRFGEEVNPPSPPMDKRLFTRQERDAERGVCSGESVMEYPMILAYLARSFALALLDQWLLGVACVVALCFTWRIGARSGAPLQRWWAFWLLSPALLPVTCLALAARYIGAAPAWALLTVQLMPVLLVAIAVMMASKNRRWVWFVVVVATTQGWLLATAWWIATMAMTG
jgi:hypothetical protein